MRNLPGIKTRYDNVDLVIVRENTEGLYSGIENEIVPGVVTSIKVATRNACTRIARFAFRYATRRHRKKITVFHKANIMKMSDGLFLDCARKIYEEEYPNIEYDELIVDAGCMKLVQDPTPNRCAINGESLRRCDERPVCGAGRRTWCGAGSNSAKSGVFEAVHGSAPDIAGKGIANPLALIMSAGDDAEPSSRRADRPARSRPPRRGAHRRQDSDPRPRRLRQHVRFAQAIVAKLA